MLDVSTCIHHKRSHAPDETNARTVITSFGDCRNLAPLRSWDGLMTGRNLSPHSQGSWAGQHEAAVTASRNSQGSSADMPGRDTATLMAEAKAPHTVVSLISVTWHPTAGFHCWGHVRGRKHCQCQAELLDSPMAASFIRSVNVGQDDPDTKESTRISFQKMDASGGANSPHSSGH